MLFRHPALCGEVDQMISQPVASAPADEDDITLAAMYLRMWSLATGRRLQPGRRLEDLTEDELVGFWAEDVSPVSGRHAARNADAAGDAR